MGKYQTGPSPAQELATDTLGKHFYLTFEPAFNSEQPTVSLTQYGVTSPDALQMHVLPMELAHSDRSL